MSLKRFCIDLDGTLLFAGKPVAKENFVLGNPVLGVVRDLLVEKGIKPRKALRQISKECQKLQWWDYPDVVTGLNLAPDLFWARVEEWQKTHLAACKDAVAMVKELRKIAETLFVVSNNPTSGCFIKLKLAGLGTLAGSSIFDRVFGADILKGMKHRTKTWERLLAQVNCDPAEVAVIGDHPVDDAEVPLSCGIARAIIIDRQLLEGPRQVGRTTFVPTPQEAVKILQEDISAQ